MFVETLKKEFDYNEPIFTYEILDLFKQYTKAYVLRLLKRAVEKKEIVKFCRGVYFFPEMTEIGPSTIIAEDVVRKRYLEYKGERYGVICGLGLDNAFHLCPQMSNVIEVITNNESTNKRIVWIDGVKVTLYKPRCKITKNNWNAYAIMQVLTQFNPKGNTYEEVREVIDEYMKYYGIEDESVSSMSKYFPAYAVDNLMKCGVLSNAAM